MLLTQTLSSRLTSLRRLTAASRTGLLVLALSGLIVSRASAGRRAPNTKPQQYKQTYDVIESVDPSAHTITIATMEKEVAASHQNQGHDAKSSKSASSHEATAVTLKVSNFTDIQLNGQKSTFGALKKGMKVDVTRGTDEGTADRVVATQ